MEELLTILIAFLSLIFGYLISIWQDWFRPWIRILEVDGGTRNRDKIVDIPEELIDLSKDSTMIVPFNSKNINLGKIIDIFDLHQSDLYSYQEGKVIIDSIVNKMKKVKNDKEIFELLESFLDNDSIKLDLLTFINRNKLAIPEFDRYLEPKLIGYYDNEEGCFAIDFDENIIYLGYNLNKNEAEKEKFQKFVHLIVRAETGKLIELFNKFIPLWYKQYETNPEILKILHKIIQENSSWGIKFSISNYGNKPFILIPDETKMVLESENHNFDPFNVQLLKKTERDDQIPWVQIKSHLLIEPGTNKDLMVVTTKTQNEMENGRIIREIFNSGTSSVYVLFSIIEPNFSLKRKIKSNLIKFSE